MYVVTHQYPRMNRYIVFLSVQIEPTQIATSILIIEKADHPVVTPMNNMKRQPRRSFPQLPWHKLLLLLNWVRGFFPLTPFKVVDDFGGLG